MQVTLVAFLVVMLLMYVGQKNHLPQVEIWGVLVFESENMLLNIFIEYVMSLTLISLSLSTMVMYLKMILPAIGVIETVMYIVNTYGRSLLNFCISYSLCIVNGRLGHDLNKGEFTFHSSYGSSVIDYFICSTNIFHMFSDFVVDVNPESDHMPILKYVRDNELPQRANDDSKMKTETRYNINMSKCELYKHLLQTSVNTCDFAKLDNMLDNSSSDVNVIVSEFEGCIANFSKEFITKRCLPRKGRNSLYDNECRNSKKSATKLLSKYISSLADIHLNLY